MSWICRMWTETSLDGWTSEMLRFGTQEAAEECGRIFIRLLARDELSREYELWEEP